MKSDTENHIPLSEANKDFSKVIEKVESLGRVVLVENGGPKYVISKFEDQPIELTENEVVEVVARRILAEHKHAFEELAK